MILFQLTLVAVVLTVARKHSQAVLRNFNMHTGAFEPAMLASAAMFSQLTWDGSEWAIKGTKVFRRI